MTCKKSVKPGLFSIFLSGNPTYLHLCVVFVKSPLWADRMENAHTKEPAECLAYFGVSESTGLAPDQVKKNQAKYGFNGEESMDKWMEAS